MKKIVLGLALHASGLAHAGCPEFLEEIKPYQLSYSRATTIFQQQAALTSIQVIQNQYQGQSCKFRLDAFNEQVRLEREEEASEQRKKEIALNKQLRLLEAREAAAMKREESEQRKKEVALAAAEEKKRQAQEQRSEIYAACVGNIASSDAAGIRACNDAYNGGQITTADVERAKAFKAREEKTKQKARSYLWCVAGLRLPGDQDAIDKCEAERALGSDTN